MYEFLRYRVADAMTPSPITTSPDASLAELQSLFETHDFNGVPVVDDEQRMLGIVTKLDVLAAFVFSAESIVPPYEATMERTADSVMTRNPVTVDLETPLSRVLQKMVEMRTKSFPVEQAGKVVGIVSREDVLKALRRATDHQIPDESV